MAAIRTPEQELARFRGRLAVAGIVALIGFGLLVARFFYLQVVRYDYYSTRAEDNRISLVPIVPNRGLITDRNGTVLARNYSAYTLEITPSKVVDLDATIEELSRLVDIQPKDRKRLKKLMDESKSFESLPLRNRLSDEEVARFIAQRYRFPGVELKARLFRDYPMGSFASHVIGYIGRINDRDLERIEESEDSPTTGAPTTSANPASKKATSGISTASPASKRWRWTPAAAPCACCAALRPSRATTWS
jgi:penicillin-binding protein 2